MRRATILCTEIYAIAAISIHALHEESDVARYRVEMHLVISIHALHEESDLLEWPVPYRRGHFNPRSP